MKFSILSLSTALVASLSFLAPVLAEDASLYAGGGYTVKIVGFAGSASYTGCDRKNRCLTIPEASNYSRGSYVWENEGYTYSMSPVGSSGKYRLRIFNPKGKALLNQVMNPK
ncbi:hypothetical protein [Brunnivagina elsteri]|uniref:Uncharacterized protein n=1 Tax=Brunnivagina elsteri CCALA 953 TaxID=987040 RepID=A0A2A2TD28_9CYAN|nr:hypothetical protein [Calothrix elsteri]PAX51660.1 hypothetical protein CK510_23605 [Calothrix elsteri CCALA 953]